MFIQHCCIAGIFLIQDLSAASIQINWSVEPGREIYNQSSTALSAGSAIDGDGSLLQLGFYSAATLSNPFAGSWVILASASVGDAGVNQPGRFNVTTTLTAGTFASPAVGTPLSIRYYDGLSAAISSYFNAASDKSCTWNWVAPGDLPPVINAQITKLNGVFQSGVIGAFQTAIRTGVPEPDSSALLLLGGGLLGFRRRNP